MLSDEWLSRYGLLENFNASVTRTRTGTWTTGVTAAELKTELRAVELKTELRVHPNVSVCLQYIIMQIL